MRIEVYTAVQIDIYFPTARLILKLWLKIAEFRNTTPLP